MLCFAAFSQILPLVYIYYLNSSKNIFIVKMFSPKQWYFPGRTSGGFCDVDLHFVFILHLSMFFIHIFFSTSSLTLPWIINRFLEPFCTFSPTHRRVICDAFIFQPSRYLLTASATVFEWAFFTHKHFLPYAPSQHFLHNLLLSRLPWEPAVFPWNLQGFILILETQTQPIWLFDLQ